MAAYVAFPELSAGRKHALAAFCGGSVARFSIGIGHRLEEGGLSPESGEIAAALGHRNAAEAHTIGIDKGEMRLAIDNLKKNVARRIVEMKNSRLVKARREAGKTASHQQDLRSERRGGKFIETTRVRTLHADEKTLRYQSSFSSFEIGHRFGTIYSGRVHTKRILIGA